MNQPADTRLIGFFVLGALALAVALTLIFGGGHYFGGAERYVAYFEGSVNGLNAGAPVKLKGVTIGRVSDILVRYDLEHNRVLTPVIADIDLGKVFETGDNPPARRRPSLRELVDRGLRARLAVQSLVTNQLYMDLSFLPDQPARQSGGDDLGLPEIPTLPSSRDEIENTVRDVMAEVRELPLKETVEATLRSIRRVEQLLSAPEIQASIANLNRTLEDLQRLIRHVDARVDTLSGSLEGTARESQVLLKTLNGRMGPLLDTTNKALGSVNETFAQAKGTLSAVEGMTEPDSELSAALRDLSEAARLIRGLAETLERNPESLIYGRNRREKGNRD